MIPLDEVYRQYSDMIYRWLLAKTGSEDLAEEITQETFYQAVLHVDNYDHSCKVSTWLCSIASNKLKEYYRKNPQRPEAKEEDIIAEGPEESVIAGMQRLDLYKVIHNLPDPAREVVHLRIFADLSFKEIGDIFGKSEGWARVTYYRAKTALGKELGKNE